MNNPYNLVIAAAVSQLTEFAFFMPWFSSAHRSDSFVPGIHSSRSWTEKL